MGGQTSKEAVENNQNFALLVGPTPFALEDPFWKNLFQFSWKVNELGSFEVQLAFRDLCEQFATNAPATHNFEQLARHVIASLKSCNTTVNSVPRELTTKLFIMRMFTAWFVENTDDIQLQSIFCSPALLDVKNPPQGVEDWVSYGLLNALFNFLIDVQVNDYSYFAHLEAASLLLTLYSTRLFRNLRGQNSSNYFLDLSFVTSPPSNKTPFNHARLTHTLLSHALSRHHVPPESSQTQQQPRGVLHTILKRNPISRVASSIISFPFNLISYFFPEPDTCPLADVCAQIFLVLVFHRLESVENPFLKTVKELQDTPTFPFTLIHSFFTNTPVTTLQQHQQPQTPTTPTPTTKAKPSKSSSGVTPLPLSTADVVTSTTAGNSNPPPPTPRATNQPTNDPLSVLILYILAHHNRRISDFLISGGGEGSGDSLGLSARGKSKTKKAVTSVGYGEKMLLEAVVLPILEAVAHFSSFGAPTEMKTYEMNEAYMLLVVLLILSKDPNFSKQASECRVSSVSWLREKYIKDCSLQSLIVIVLVRCVIHVCKLDDTFLHSNCLAILTNLSHNFANLHPVASQRLVALLDVVARKYLTHHTAPEENNTAENSNTADSSIPSQLPLSPRSETSDTMHVMDEESLNLLIEIFSSALCTPTLKRNHNLLYELMRQQHTLARLANLENSRFHKASRELFELVAHFRSRVDAIAPKNSHVDVILKGLEQEVQQFEDFPSASLVPIEEKIFTYEEEADPREFFIPYLWSLVFCNSRTIWNQESVIAFDTHAWLPPDFTEDLYALEDDMFPNPQQDQNRGDDFDSGGASTHSDKSHSTVDSNVGSDAVDADDDASHGSVGDDNNV